MEKLLPTSSAARSKSKVDLNCFVPADTDEARPQISALSSNTSINDKFYLLPQTIPITVFRVTSSAGRRTVVFARLIRAIGLYLSDADLCSMK